MTPLLTLLPKLVPVVLRHLSGYLELAAADAGDLLRGVVRRLVAAAVALLGALFTVLMACVWIISSVWNTEWRSAAIGGLFLLFAAITASGAVMAARRWPQDRRPFGRLRTEWDSDQELLRDVTTRQPVAEQHMAARVDA